MELDTDSWSGEGAFTQVLVDALRTIEAVSFVRVEDASSSHADVEYNFISNELFVRFQTREREVQQRRFGMIPVRRQVEEAVMTMNGLERELGEKTRALAAAERGKKQRKQRAQKAGGGFY